MGCDTWQGTGWQPKSPPAEESPARDGGSRAEAAAACAEQMSNQNSSPAPVPGWEQG